MAHAELVLQNLKLYQNAQAKLKVMCRRVLEEDKVYCGVVEMSPDLYILAAMYRTDDKYRIRVQIQRGLTDDIATPIWFMPYLEFMRAFPEFGRRDVWKEEWTKCPQWPASYS